MKSKTLPAGNAAIAVCALAMGGCASSPDQPLEQLARAEQSIEIAEQNGAREFGAPALDKAQTNLARARLAANQGEYEAASRLAVQAELDAELAAAQSSHGKAKESLREVNASIATLREEIARESSE